MRVFLITFLSFAFACSPAEPETPDAAVDPVDLLSGVYNVEAVTCAGEDEPISVVATVTFDEGSYLEEWEFPNSDCALSLSGNAALDDDDALTLEDVVINCTGDCPPGICESECSVDQVYDVTRAENELLLSFTQEGDEFGCGACGDGVASTYLLVE